ncbi:hypothetical protein KGF57_004625 [Candida theae]|uniref:Uncharacterized protein n=1 Tax=Candida theae TaxID=1198502 RepID=A0AAD5BAW8_9ASCO|nr:uncharacterized protein KGF57_004625 [Candida theae]KAI5949802.1 hypothetical protein KGF57_004625 [Candida theae]
MVAQRILSISNIQTAARHWVPIAKHQITKYPKPQSTQLISKQFYSSRIRCVNYNYNNINDVSLVSNDDVINASATSSTRSSTNDDAEPFEPTIYSSEDIHTAGPVNRA